MQRIWIHLAAASLVAVSACGSDSTSPGGPPVQTNQVSIVNNAFTPSNIQVTAGTTVTWTWNSGGTPHNVTFSDASSGDKTGGATYTRTFATPGTFTYHCTIHPEMTGSVTVQ